MNLEVENGLSNMIKNIKENLIENFKNELENYMNQEKNFTNKIELEKNETTYNVDEIGDDEKYVFLTDESTGQDFQEFNISDELYEKILNYQDKDNLKLVKKNGIYNIKNN